MTEYDLIIRGGLIYDGSGGAPFRGDVAINGDTLAAVGDLGDARGRAELDASGLAVAPGFINMLSWATESLIEDGRSQSDIRQGVTLEVMGEGASMGPLNEAMKQTGPNSFMAQGDIRYTVEWTTLGEYLEFLERRGVSCNVASFVGSETVRVHVMGYENRAPTDDELLRMCDLVAQAMAEGAMGLSAALIYPPACYAGTDELIDLMKIAGAYGGMYISHLRSEGAALLDALEEFIDIISAAETRGEIYHLKAAGQANWDHLDAAIEMIEETRADGLPITADMYPYPFSGTGLDACIPPWAHVGGRAALLERLKDSAQRERIRHDMLTPSLDWENMYHDNTPDGILLAGFRTEALKPLAGRTLAEVAAQRGTSPEDTLLDLIVEDESRVFSMYFSMSEDNLRKQVALPWVTFCSDAQSLAPEGMFLKTIPHPRAYGSFARVLARYVRDEKIIPLEQAIHRLTALPAANLRIDRRGELKAGYFADVVAFDPDRVQDHATPENPHQYATGVLHVWVNGVQVLRDGEHTGAKPGRVVRGPGWNRQPFEADYPAALYPLLTLGNDYNGSYFEFNLLPAQIPDLIRMATDERMLFYDAHRPQRWAPKHAWRTLGQLHAAEAAEPLIGLFSMFDPDLIQEMPIVFGMIGLPAVPALTRHIQNEKAFFLGRVLALNCLREIIQATGSVDLQRMATALMGLNSVEGALLAVEAYANRAVTDSISGSWKEIRPKLEAILGEFDDPDFSHDDDDDAILFGPPSGPSKADSKKKAKRKQAKKMRKLNRKKRR